MSNTSKYKNIELEMSSKNENYLLKVRSQQGEARANFDSPFEDGEIKAFLAKVRKARLSARECEKLTGQAKLKEQDFEGFGKRLFKKVFREKARDLLMRSLPQNREENIRLRLHFEKKAAKLARLPWEYLWNPTEDDFFCIYKSTSIVRYLEMPKQMAPLKVEGQLRILVAIANPHNDLDVGSEVNHIQQALEPLKERGSIFCKIFEKTAWSSLKEELNKGNYHILHFVGHGTFDAQKEEGSLLLEDGPVKHKDLRRFIGNISSLRLAILNSCNGAKSSESDVFVGVAQQFVKAGIPAVVAMQFTISDKAAIKFASEFYKELIYSGAVESAFVMARVALAETSDNDSRTEWGTPVLFLRSDSTRIFNTLPTTKGLPSHYANHNIPALSLLPYLSNRQEQEYTLTKALENVFESPANSLVCIVHGNEGQCIDKFIERLKKVSLSKFYRARGQSSKVPTYDLMWPTSFRNKAELIRKMTINLVNLAERISGQRGFSLEDTKNFLAHIPADLILIHTHVLSEDWLAHKDDIIEGYLDFWQKWELPYGQVLVALLCVKYQFKDHLPFWHQKRRRYKRINSQIENYLDTVVSEYVQEQCCIVLPKLDDIKRSEAEGWARRYQEDCQYDIDEMIEEIGQIYDTWEKEEKQAAIPMQPLAKQLKDLLCELAAMKEV